jgi:TetR/AcrR family transcriptional regulator
MAVATGASKISYVGTSAGARGPTVARTRQEAHTIAGMGRAEVTERRATRRWGDEVALLDDAEARRRLIEATTQCIVRRGNAQFRMGEVADEAGVARSTLYRYFSTRADLILAVLVSRVDPALEVIVRSLPDPADAARSLPDLILEPISLVEGDALNEALFSPVSSAQVSSLEMSSEAILDAAERHFGPLLARWQADGQVHADLDVRETLRWINAIALFLLAPPWRQRSIAAKHELLERYLVRALVVTPAKARSSRGQ